MLGIAFAAALQLQSSSPPPPTAESVEEVLRRGVELRRNGDNEHAVLEFRRAYAMNPSPRTAGQLGLAEQALLHWAETDRYLSEALAATDDPWVVRHRDALEGAAQWMREHVGALEVRGGTSGAEVLVDGVVRGTLPLAPVRLQAGTYTLEVRLAMYYPVTRRVVVEADHVTIEPIELRPRQAVATSSAAPSSAPVSPSRAAETTSRDRASYVPWIAGTGVAALAFVGVGFGLLVDRENQALTFNDPVQRCPRDVDVASLPSNCRALYHQGMEVDVPIATTMFGLAVVSAGVGTYLLARAVGPSRRVAAMCSPWSTMTGAVCAVSF